MSGMRIDFEDYLQGQHALDYSGTGDNMGKAFNDWLEGFDAEDWIDFANLYAKKLTT